MDRGSKPLLYIILSAIISLALFPHGAHADSAPSLYIVPSHVIALIGDDFSEDICVAEVADLKGWEFKLYYSKSIVNGVAITEGAFLSQEGLTGFFIVEFSNDYNETHGCIWLTCVLLENRPGVTGNGTIAHINFTVVGTGSTKLTLADTVLGDSQAITINHTLSDASIIISPYDVTRDGFVGIDDIVIVAEHFGEDPGNPWWSPIYDITGDDYIGIDDVILVAEHFGEFI